MRWYSKDSKASIVDWWHSKASLVIRQNQQGSRKAPAFHPSTSRLSHTSCSTNFMLNLAKPSKVEPVGARGDQIQSLCQALLGLLFTYITGIQIVIKSLETLVQTSSNQLSKSTAKHCKARVCWLSWFKSMVFCNFVLQIAVQEPSGCTSKLWLRLLLQRRSEQNRTQCNWPVIFTNQACTIQPKY